MALHLRVACTWLECTNVATESILTLQKMAQMY